jgi:hypothetical protein
MARMYLARSSWFDTHKYDTNKIKAVLKKEGAGNIRTAYAYGWSNQPKVVCFNVKNLKHVNKIKKALEKALGTQWLIIHKKDW